MTLYQLQIDTQKYTWECMSDACWECMWVHTIRNCMLETHVAPQGHMKLHVANACGMAEAWFNSFSCKKHEFFVVF